MASLREFEFHERLGRGGFGEVYRATMRTGDREIDVAVKLLHHAVGNQHQAVERLRDEARILGMVAHPGVPTPHGVTYLDGRVALVVEYIDGLDLNRLGALPPGTGMRVLEKVASALHSARVTVVDGEPIHVVHRDVKPSNVRVAVDGRVKLLDFGIARMDARERETDTHTDEMLGSVAYLAPERLIDGCNEAPQDVFALGATFFESLTGQQLLHRQLARTYVVLGDAENFQAHLDERFATAGLPGPIETLLRRMLAYTPKDRPDAHAVSCEAHRLAGGLGGSTIAGFVGRLQPDARVPGPLTGKRLREVRRATLYTDPEVSDHPATVLYDAERPRPDGGRPRTDEVALPPRAPAIQPSRSGSLGSWVASHPLLTVAGGALFVAFLWGLGAVVFGIVFAVA